MNNQNPLVPQGSALEQKNKGRARVKIAVFFVLAIHGVGLMALLMQGCGQTKEQALPQDTLPTNTTPAFAENTNIQATTSNPPATTVTPVTPVTPVMPEVTSPPITPAGATEYTIAKGDTLDKIHNNLHVSVKAIIEANPGIEPKKLKVGQKIHIPAPTAPTTPTTPPAPAGIGAAPTDAPSVSGEQTYKVKSGDNLTKIATQHHVSLKALRAANGLKVDSIKVGQKLKIPAKSSAPTTAPVPPVESVPTTPSAR